MTSPAYIQRQRPDLEVALNSNVGTVSYEELEGMMNMLREEADRLLAQADQQIANDDLQSGLEIRYGSGFAQWIIDRLN